MVKVYSLSDTYISKHITDFLGSYNNVDCTKIISYNGFRPQSFVVEDKRSNKELLFFQDISYTNWIRDMIMDQIKKTSFSQQEKLKILDVTIKNIEILLNYYHEDNIVSYNIYNQEFVDLIRKVLYFTITGKSKNTLATAQEFNLLADRIMPYIIDFLSKEKPDLKTLFILSILSGISGLDLKGSPAASSSYVNTGIAMKPYLCMTSQEAAFNYLEKLYGLLPITQSSFFEWDELMFDIKNGNRLVWMTDDYIESYFDLLIISELLNQYNNLVIEIIPKNGLYGNDLSVNQLDNLIQGLFSRMLIPHLNSGNFIINRFGPKMGAANIKKLSKECVNSLRNADIILLKGCRIFEMLQGGICGNSYSAFTVSRTISEITTGLNAKEFPIVLCHLKPKDYAFWGMDPRNAKNELFNDGRIVTMCTSTLSDHIKRKNMTNPLEIIVEFQKLKKLLEIYIGDPQPVYQEMDMVANKLMDITKNTYNNMCNKYQELRHDKLHRMDQLLWDNLECYIKAYIKKAPENIKMLDVATGSGRDIMYANSRGYKVIGIDNSDGFISILKQLNREKKIPDGSFANNDMRSLQFADSSFDVVRHNASLLHLPLIAKGYMADKAISEAYRVLAVGGLLYVFVKKGDALQFVDTGEGLGGRVFQFYTHKMINELLQRHGFIIVYTSDEFEERPSGNVEWISVIAQKE